MSYGIVNFFISSRSNWFSGDPQYYPSVWPPHCVPNGAVCYVYSPPGDNNPSILQINFSFTSTNYSASKPAPVLDLTTYPDDLQYYCVDSANQFFYLIGNTFDGSHITVHTYSTSTWTLQGLPYEIPPMVDPLQPNQTLPFIVIWDFLSATETLYGSACDIHETYTYLFQFSLKDRTWGPANSLVIAQIYSPYLTQVGCGRHLSVDPSSPDLDFPTISFHTPSPLDQPSYIATVNLLTLHSTWLSSSPTTEYSFSYHNYA